MVENNNYCKILGKKSKNLVQSFETQKETDSQCRFRIG